ncbi:hypothetical protein U9M48_007517 [Paspalum notatum var. saurae]|uniref:Uncharacterized protein n=1 Tax=Paspalum notatum var. saurae TaxID=547442 RepID=A0AAQ3Q0N5_PASNO
MRSATRRRPLPVRLATLPPHPSPHHRPPFSTPRIRPQAANDSAAAPSPSSAARRDPIPSPWQPRNGGGDYGAIAEEAMETWLCPASRGQGPSAEDPRDLILTPSSHTTAVALGNPSRGVPSTTTIGSPCPQKVSCNRILANQGESPTKSGHERAPCVHCCYSRPHAVTRPHARLPALSQGRVTGDTAGSEAERVCSPEAAGL